MCPSSQLIWADLLFPLPYPTLSFPGDFKVQRIAWNAGNQVDPWGRSLGEGNVYPLQYSCLGISKARWGLWGTVHGVATSPTWTEQLTLSLPYPHFTFCFWITVHPLRTHLWKVLFWLCPAKLYPTFGEGAEMLPLIGSLPATSQLPSPAPANLQTDTQIHTVEIIVFSVPSQAFKLVLQGLVVLLLFGWFPYFVLICRIAKNSRELENSLGASGWFVGFSV